MIKRIFIGVFIFCLAFINYRSPQVLAQGREYERIRAATLPGEPTPIPGEVAPSVEYYIAVEDSMEVFVWQNPDLSKDLIVGPDGKISYPLVGRIQAAGKTIGQLEEELKEKLSKYIKSPQVSIMMKKFSGDKIIILGEVNYPGIYTFKGTINLLEAIASAGDFTEKARQDSVMIVRGNLTEKPEVTRINMLRVIRQGTSNTNIVLKPNDAIYVPRSFIANFNKFLDNIRPTIDNAMTVLDIRREIRTLGGHAR